MPKGEMVSFTWIEGGYDYWTKSWEMMKPSGLERECGLDIPDKRSHRTKTPRGSQGPRRFLLSLPRPGRELVSRSLRMPRWAWTWWEWTCHESKFSEQDSNPLSKETAYPLKTKNDLEMLRRSWVTSVFISTYWPSASHLHLFYHNPSLQVEILLGWPETHLGFSIKDYL